ncbi:uncharacterized protein B0H18DRAFT_134066 [Fomitopsis serialis]|uniref:uncharacterized protein n=1 Tax=Fomitopsis serialis TaxID=139415 RepID=UPI0020081D49|nr:uncharacterized protein B0H18DRAFT_134066 [Neoantrodia serialis]KAH9930737.1 hypothetical protein B0H18DRAFT_134066 [Neoantrodia serialis]
MTATRVIMHHPRCSSKSRSTAILHACSYVSSARRPSPTMSRNRRQFEQTGTATCLIIGVQNR